MAKRPNVPGANATYETIKEFSKAAKAYRSETCAGIRDSKRGEKLFKAAMKDLDAGDKGVCKIPTRKTEEQKTKAANAQLAKAQAELQKISKAKVGGAKK